MTWRDRKTLEAYLAMISNLPKRKKVRLLTDVASDLGLSKTDIEDFLRQHGLT